MSGSTSGPLVPTFHGFVQNSMDGLMLFEACLSGKLHHVPRRPHDRERASLIKSGSVFIYEENASGIKRWTDGVAWSPSRILGNFLIYRELEKPFPPGEKKRAMKRKRSSQIDPQLPRRESEDATAAVGDVSMPPTPPSPPKAGHQQQDGSASGGSGNASGGGGGGGGGGGVGGNGTASNGSLNPDPAAPDANSELDRQLIGSLVDSYGFRPDGLVKKTMSIAINGVSHHLVSYYKVQDVKDRTLRRPMDDSRLVTLSIRPELYLKQNFRTPVEETEHFMVNPNNMHAHPGVSHPHMMPGAYDMRTNPYMAPPPPPPPPQYSMYGMPVSSAAMYNTNQAWAPPPQSYPPNPYQPQGQYGSYYHHPLPQPQQAQARQTPGR